MFAARQLIIAALLTMYCAPSAQAALVGRLPITPGGSDWQAYYDDQLDITWAVNSSINGFQPWAEQMDWVSTLTIGGFDGWRLPNMDVNGDDLIVDCGGGTSAEPCLDNEYGYMFFQNGVTPGSPGAFENLISFAYWSITTVEDNVPPGTWSFDFAGEGNQYISHNVDGAYAWAVRSGDVSLVPLPGALWLLGSALLGAVGFGRRRSRQFSRDNL